jgi:hypothetical protein
MTSHTICRDMGRLGFRAEPLSIEGLSERALGPSICVIASEPDRFTSVRASVETILNKQLADERRFWGPALDQIRTSIEASVEDFDRELADRSVAQPWIIMDEARGGLETLKGRVEKIGGTLVVCSAATHHGVVRSPGLFSDRPVLVTGRAARLGWQSPSDFGHEAVHAGFAQVPLYSQHLEQVSHGGFSDLLANSEITRDAIAAWSYVSAEILVWFIRRERQDTVTGLPRLQAWADLDSFLRLGTALGYRLASESEWSPGYGRAEVGESRSRELAALCWRIQRATVQVLASDEPPDFESWRSANGRVRTQGLARAL